MSMNVQQITLDLKKYKFLGITIVGLKGVDGDIYIGSILKGGAVAADGRIEAGDMLLQVNDVNFEDICNGEAVDYLRKVSREPGPLTLTIGKCWDPPSPTIENHYSDSDSDEEPVSKKPRLNEPIRPIDPAHLVRNYVPGFRMPKLKIAPSILNSNLGNLVGECRKLLSAGADTLHLDIMDGHFVPNLTFGHPIVDSLRKNLGPGPFLDCHLMIENPQKWVKDYAAAGANQMVFHLEAVDGKDEAVNLVQAIGSAGMLAGVAIKPGTDVGGLLEVMRECRNKDVQVSLALIMTVEPGFGGQKFMAGMLEKVKTIRTEFTDCDIQVDGGVGVGNIGDCWSAGANVIVSGSAIIKSTNWNETITQMKATCQ